MFYVCLVILKTPQIWIWFQKIASYSNCFIGCNNNPCDISIFRMLEERVSIIGGHVTAASDTLTAKPTQNPSRTRPPITTHVLDVSRGSPASGIEVLLEKWKGNQARPIFGATDSNGWAVQGSSSTDSDGRSGQLINIVDDVDPGIYRISFNTGKYNPNGFFPSVSIVFEILESQTRQHFHVPLLLSPFSFSTYRGS